MEAGDLPLGWETRRQTMVVRSSSSRVLWLLCAAVMVGSLRAQGPITRERWTFAQLEELRRTLLDECRERGEDVLRAVTEELVSNRNGERFRPVLRALARVRGVQPDAAFLYRGTLRAVTLPEIVDPDGDNPECRDLHVTYYLPYTIGDPGAVRIEVTVQDGFGTDVWSGTVSDDTAVDDLLRYRPRCSVPGAELPDGSYTVRSRVYLDGEPPRAADPQTVFFFSVLRGFQARAEGLFRRRAALQAGGLDPAPLAILRGVVGQVERVYAGEPAAGRRQHLRDLANAQQVVENLEQGRAATAGLAGRVNLALPAGPGEEVAFVALRLPVDDQPRPLVLFLPGGPAYDHRSSRPASPRSTGPGWWGDILVDRNFDSAGRWHWAVMESPGRVANSGVALQSVLSALSELFEVAAGQVCLVGERQGAWVVSQSQTFPKPSDTPVAGLVVLVGGGNLSLDKLREGDLKVLGVPSQGHSGSTGLERLGEMAASDSLSMLNGSTRPWPLVLGSALPEIGVFLEQLFRDG